MELREININDKDILYDLYEEVVSNTNGNTFEGFRELGSIKASSYEDWLNDLELKKDKKNLPGTYSPQINYLMLEDNYLIGVITIRWELVPILLYYGGNIGYMIRPSKRKHGYGKKMLNLLLEEKVRGKLDKVLVTCRKDNEASKKLIESSGGIFDNEVYVKEEGCIYLRYWIYL